MLNGIRKCVVGTETGDLQLWDFASHSCELSLRLDTETYSSGVCCAAGHEREVTSVSFTNDSRKVISASSDGTIRVWELANFKCENILQVGEAVTYVQILQDDIHCVCITQTGMYFSIWNLLSGECCKIITAYRKSILWTAHRNQKRM